MNLKSLLVTPVFAAVCLVIAGCDFDSGLEGKPTKKFDSELTGTWHWEGPGDNMNVVILPKDGYTVTGKAWPDSEADKVESFTGFSSEVAGATFLSLDFGKKGKPAFLIARVTKLDPKSVRYEQVDSDSAFAKDKKGTPIERLERHLNDRDLFLTAKVFTKLH